MFRQHTALDLRENANVAESSAILHQKNAIHLFQNSSFSIMEQIESDTGENSGGRDLTRISANPSHLNRLNLETSWLFFSNTCAILEKRTIKLNFKKVHFNLSHF